MTVRTSPCEWPVDYGSCVLPDRWVALTAEQRGTYEAMAVDYLWRWTGQSLGVCEVVLRPCRQDCTEGVSTFYGSGPYAGSAGVTGGSGRSGFPWLPVPVGGQMLSLGCGRCGDRCSCDSPASLTLPGPVDSVTSVIIDGDTVPVEGYEVQSHRYLIRRGGLGWPTCQSLGRAAGEPGTWSITYRQGVPVPTGGQVAAGTLAVELFKAACSDASCALPRRVQSITRQGVSIAVLDAFDDIDKGHTGIWVIDSWVASVTAPPQRSRVFSPDIPRPRHRVTTWPTSITPPDPPPSVVDGGTPTAGGTLLLDGGSPSSPGLGTLDGGTP